jgi:hypothetical protein
LKEARVIAFVITSGDQTGPVIAALLTKHADKMAKLASTVRRPAIFSINRSGAPVPLKIS